MGLNEIEKISNEIIKIFIDKKTPLSKQLDILKLAKAKIEFCRNTAKDLKKKDLFD